MKNLTLLLTLALLLAHVSPSYGDWFYDFDDEHHSRRRLSRRALRLARLILTDTFEASADGGVLRIWDTVSPA